MKKLVAISTDTPQNVAERETLGEMLHERCHSKFPCNSSHTNLQMTFGAKWL